MKLFKHQRIIIESLKMLKGLTMEKNKGGRPRKESKGRNVFVPAEIVDMVVAMVDTFRKQQQAKQATQ